MTVQDRAPSSVNVTGTDRKIDVWLTQPRSGPVRYELAPRCTIEDPRFCLGARCQITGICDYNRRHHLTLAKVHGQSSGYYRAALMPFIRAAVARLEARS